MSVWMGEGEPGSAPRVWLAVLGLSDVLGSEPMVAWQWYLRLKARGPLTVLTAAIFDELNLIPAEARQDMVFLDTKPLSEAEFANNHKRHVLRWWTLVRAHLKAHARAGDVLLIMAPAAIWMFPFISGLPMRRRDILFGPAGFDLVPFSISRFGRMQMRNLGLVAAAIGWVVLSPLLPAKIAFRSPRRWYHAPLAISHQVLGFVPDFDLPALEPDFAEPVNRSPVSLLYDDRPRKRFAKSLACATEIARREGRRLVVVACPPEQMDLVRAQAQDVELVFVERMSREGFLNWIRQHKPWHVTLSASEACSATVVEVLMMGGRIVSHNVGGLSWLIAASADVKSGDWGGSDIFNYRWDEGALDRFSSLAGQGYDSIMNSVLPTQWQVQ